MANSAEEAILLSESEKFLRVGTAPLNLSNKSQAVVADKKIPAFAYENLKTQGIQVIHA